MKRRKFLQSCGSIATLAASSAPLKAAEQNMPTLPDYKSSGAKLLASTTPAVDRFHFPAEWEEHESTIMVMPPPQNWQGYGVAMDKVREQWANVANKLSEFEHVLMVVHPDEKKKAKEILSKEIELVEFCVNDGWARDSGPMILVNDRGDRRIAGFTFNGWGAKFPPYKDDAMLKGNLSHHLDFPLYPIPLVLEGGAVSLDGEGTILTTAQCLLNQNRNSAYDRVAIEKLLNDSLGATKVIWLQKGLEPDPITDGHVDGIAAFVQAGVVLLHTTRDKNDRNYAICQDAKRRLQEATDAKGRKLDVIELPLDGDLSHMNFYLGNDCVLVPITTNPEEDKRPLGILREVFADRKVIGIDSRILAKGGWRHSLHYTASPKKGLLNSNFRN